MLVLFLILRIFSKRSRVISCNYNGEKPFKKRQKYLKMKNKNLKLQKPYIKLWCIRQKHVKIVIYHVLFLRKKCS